MKIAYTVRCRFTDPDVAEQWLRWLHNEHLQDVCGRRCGKRQGRTSRP